MKVSSAEFPNEVSLYPQAFEKIATHVEKHQPDLLVLPEMPFTPWVFHQDIFDEKIWDNVVAQNDEWVKKFSKEVSVPLITSRPVNEDGKRYNQAFYMSSQGDVRPLRSKCYLPNDFPAVEVPWFDEDAHPEQVFEIGDIQMGIQLCSEIMYSEIPRKIGQKGAHILIQPRATGGSPRWRAAAVLAAATSGAFVIGANRRSIDCDWFSGGSWVLSPNGQFLAETSDQNPIETVEIDLNQSMLSKSEYPLSMYSYYSGTDM